MAAFQLTLTNADQNYHLLDLIRAQEADFRDVADEISILANEDNAAAKVRLGSEANLSDTKYGYVLNAGEGRVYEARKSIGGIYARTDVAGAKLQIDIVR